MNKYKKSRIKFLKQGIKRLIREAKKNEDIIESMRAHHREFRYNKRWDRIMLVPLSSKEASKIQSKRLILKKEIEFYKQRISDYTTWLNKELGL